MNGAPKHDTILILDFGSQYTQLIARRLREIGVYCEIWPYNADPDSIVALRPKGLILSGGPSSVYDEDAPRLDARFLAVVDCPILGICYGLQLLTHLLGGAVSPSPNREYGYARLTVEEPVSRLFTGLPTAIDVWLSHGDYITTVPEGFRATAHTGKALNAIESLSKRIFGVQFHPEVAHTPLGAQILRNFARDICQAEADWSAQAVIEEQVRKVGAQVGAGRAVCGLSGGVDSAVAAALVHEAIGERQVCIFVDTGLLRDGEFEATCRLFEQQMKLRVIGVRAAERFLSALRGVTDPEQKRRVIGHVFIDVFEGEAKKAGEVDFLIQGTLYPDVIESVSVRGPSAVIKSHHNVGGLPEKMRLKLVEPLRELFKDEVRVVGRELHVPEEILRRHPFPGPGLAVRIIGEVTGDKLALLRGADRIVEEEIRLAGLYDAVWQAFAVLLPVRTVGVMGDARTYDSVCALRAVTSLDGMTADVYPFDAAFLSRVATRIVNEVEGINRVVYDYTSKPPGTIEWE